MPPSETVPPRASTARDPAASPERDVGGHFVTEHRDDPRLVHVTRLAARNATTAALAQPLPDAVASRLPVPALWAHQAAAIDHLRAGRSVALATGTASGKSLAYQVPIVEAASGALGTPATSLLLFPTKALAQDQLRSLWSWDLPGMTPATYDGDSTIEERTWVRAHADVVLTNPEMLHHGLLPNHGRWATYFHRLRYVVVDELHTLRGVFGSHVAHLLRRLRRVCAHYGSDPVFVFTSATIGDPAELASILCGLPVVGITDDASPQGERAFVLWDRPELEIGSGIRTSAHGETAWLLAGLVREGTRTIAFCRSRKGTEVVAADARRRLPPGVATRVRPYRAGYLATERREIEAELFSGTLLGVVATSALELGIDVGAVDAVVLDGYPGTIASLWQQAGRAGRAGQGSLALLVAGDDQLDQWFLAHPDELFSRPPEPAVVNPTNPFVADPHLACAAYELPLTHDDEQYWPDVLDDAVRRLVHDDRLRLRIRRGEPVAVWAGQGRPGRDVGLRSGSTHEVAITLAEGGLVGTVDAARAPSLVHPGAVYLHQGQPYRVLDLDLADGVATVSVDEGDEYTEPRTEVDVRILDEEHELSVGPLTAALGAVEVTTRVTGYRRRDAVSGAVVGLEELDLPPTVLRTRAVWWTVEATVLDHAGVAPADWPGTLHAVEHAAIGILPLFTICDRWDVGGVSIAHHADTGRPTIVIYDGYPGGSGIAELGFTAVRRHLEATRDVVASCGCHDGCPSCIQSPKCGNGNEPLDKSGALALLRAVLTP